jgi:hypothetical protein
MQVMIGVAALSLLTAGEIAAQAKRVDPPVIPVGLDTYRQWEKWPYQRIGARAYMRSTYDRSGLRWQPLNIGRMQALVPATRPFLSTSTLRR